MSVLEVSILTIVLSCIFSTSSGLETNPSEKYIEQGTLKVSPGSIEFAKNEDHISINCINDSSDCFLIRKNFKLNGETWNQRCPIPRDYKIISTIRNKILLGFTGDIHRYIYRILDISTCKCIVRESFIKPSNVLLHNDGSFDLFFDIDLCDGARCRIHFDENGRSENDLVLPFLPKKFKNHEIRVYSAGGKDKIAAVTIAPNVTGKESKPEVMVHYVTPDLYKEDGPLGSIYDVNDSFIFSYCWVDIVDDDGVNCKRFPQFYDVSSYKRFNFPIRKLSIKNSQDGTISFLAEQDNNDISDENVFYKSIVLPSLGGFNDKAAIYKVPKNSTEYIVEYAYF